ncbi:MAG TPA: ArgE/DapE family deacylase [Vicinamibacterales bacterium]|jgi:acetylornithine deacetylase
MDPVLRLLCDLIAIDSVNPTLVPGAPGEAAIADALAVHMRRLGLDVSVEEVVPGRPNVIGVVEGRARGRTLMFCGHTDTVGVGGMRAPFSPDMRDGKIYGRGSQDMKSGIAAMVAAAGEIAARGLAAGRLIVAAVVDEEHSSIGADHLVTRWHADAAVVTEPTDLTIAIAHKGFEWIEVDVDGKAAHGSRPAEGEDAIMRMGRVLTGLEALDRELQNRPPHPLIGTGSLHASFISGGREWSVYPDAARLQIERRTLPGEPSTAGTDEVRYLCESLSAADHKFRARVRQVFTRPAHEVQPNDELPRALADAVVRTGGSPTLGGASFWTDAAILSGAGIPSVLFGPTGAGLHSIEEYVVGADVQRCRNVLTELAAAWCPRS